RERAPEGGLGRGRVALPFLDRRQELEGRREGRVEPLGLLGLATRGSERSGIAASKEDLGEAIGVERRRRKLGERGRGEDRGWRRGARGQPRTKFVRRSRLFRPRLLTIGVEPLQGSRGIAPFRPALGRFLQETKQIRP